MPIQVGKRVPVAIDELEDVDAVAEAARGRALQRRSVQNELDSARMVRAVIHGVGRLARCPRVPLHSVIGAIQLSLGVSEVFC
jgi:hypothetical protein